MTQKDRVRYSKEQKEAIMKRIMAPNNESVVQISNEEGITEVTLYKRRKEARAVEIASVFPHAENTRALWGEQRYHGSYFGCSYELFDNHQQNS